MSILISCRTDPTAGNLWCAHDEEPLVKNDDSALFIGHRLLETIGWIFLNGFHDRSNGSLVFQPNTCDMSPQRAKKLYTEVCRFLSEDSPDTATDGSWDKMIVFVRGNRPTAARKLLSSAEILVKNRSGEVYFRPLDLRSIENHLLQCYSIANMMWNYMKHAPSYSMQYRIFEIKGNSRLDTPRIIEELVGKLKKTAVQEDLQRVKIHKSICVKKGRPILDRFGG
jgi:hypothetical protein